MIKNINIYTNLYENISYICLNDNYHISLNKQLFICSQHVTTTYITIVHPNDIYKNNFSKFCCKYLDQNPTCDITFSSYNLVDTLTNSKEEQIFSKDSLVNKNFINKHINHNRGLVWRKSLYNLIEPSNNLEEIEQNNYNFWLRCIENNMNIINISEIPLFSIYK